MKWTHVKTLLIILLIIVDVFIGVQLYMNKAAEQSIDKTAFETTKCVLEERGFVLSDSIENSYKKLGAVKFNNIDQSVLLTAERLFGKCNFEVTEDGKKLSNDTAYVTYDSLGKFELMNFAVSSTPASEAEARKYAAQFFSDIGLPPTYYKIESVLTFAASTRVTVTQMVDNIPVLDTKLEITVSQDGIRSAKGTWFFGTLEFMHASEKDMLNMLFAVSDFYKGDEATMESAGQGYYRMYNTIEMGVESIVLASSWNVETDKGNLIYNCVSDQIVYFGEKSGS